MRSLKQILIWIKRFRYRCGYGVHSPFAFDFITNVIYEKAAYYAYQDIEHTIINDKDWKEGRMGCCEKRVNRLLFRLVNRAQPQTLIVQGASRRTSLYLQAAKKTDRYISVADAAALNLASGSTADFVYISTPDNPAAAKATFEYCVERVGQHSVFVIRGIYASAAMNTFWKQLIADERVGITFDLYDLGILFFDHSKIKQHYTVNF